MKQLRLFILFLPVLLCLRVADAAPLRLAVRDNGSAPQWNRVGHFLETPNPPLVVVSVPFPLSPDNPVPGFPPPHIPILLQLELANAAIEYDLQTLDRLSALLKSSPHISHLALKGWEVITDFNRLAFRLKTITSLARGIRPKLRIALTCSAETAEAYLADVTQALATNPETSPYFDGFFFESQDHKKLQKRLVQNAPQIRFWEYVRGPAPGSGKSNRSSTTQALSSILAANPFGLANTSLLIVRADKAEDLYPSLVRFSTYLMQGLYKDTGSVNVTYADGSSRQHHLYFRTADHTPFLFLGIDKQEKRGLAAIRLGKGLYKKAFVENLSTGDQAGFKISRTSRILQLNLQGDFFAVHFIPVETKSADPRYNIEVTGSYHLSAEEIIARVRAWNARQRALVKSFIATMTTSLRLRIGNLNETFDLTIKGPVFVERNNPYDWVWKEFYVNGVKWKSKRVPKIPLLQPEKVNIMPLDINLTEEYLYTLDHEATRGDQRIYVIDFKPRQDLENTSLYRGKMWIDAKTFAIRRQHLIQLNLKGEVLSNVETRYFKPVPEVKEIRLPLSIIGHQAFSTAGRITNIERDIQLSDIVIDPENFQQQKEQAYQSDVQMVRDTREGLKYLVKEKKTGQRKVESKTKKSQLFGVLGGFYDSSIGYPVPVLGINYMNFDLGGKGRQVNVLFGGVMLTANYSDPSFLGTRMDFGANLVGVAFPFKNKIYRPETNSELKEERLKNLPFRFQVNFGFPLGTYLKFSSSFVFNYNKFSRAKTTAEEFILPKNSFALGWWSMLTLNVKGYRLALWTELNRRNRWEYWGVPGNSDFDPKQKSFSRWRLILDKDFFLSPFRKIHLTSGYYDGRHLDRFSAFKFGFFNELNLHGYMSGVIQAKRAYTLNLSYGYSLGRAFRLEAFYDSAWITNPTEVYRNTYFSGAAISGTINVPGLNGILRFEAGMPVVNHGIRGLVLYFVMLKMF
jgi:hypothetical protein